MSLKSFSFLTEKYNLVNTYSRNKLLNKPHGISKGSEHFTNIPIII